MGARLESGRDARSTPDTMERMGTICSTPMTACVFFIRDRRA